MIGELAPAADAVDGRPATDVVGGLRLQTVNACIQFLPTLHGKALFTVEDLKTLAGRTDGPAHERLLVELGHQVALARAAGAGAGRIAGLRHEAGNHAMEHDPVIEPGLGQLLDPGDMLGRHVGKQLDQHAAARGQLDHERIVRVGGLGGGGGHEEDGSG